MKTTRAATVVLALAMATLLFPSGGEACNSVPVMGTDEACHKACPTLYQLCRATLSHAAPTAEATVFAIVAGKYAKLSYEATMDAIDRLLPSLPAGDARAAHGRCRDRYYEARSHMSGVINGLAVCDLACVRQKYVDATAAVAACGDGLSAFRSSSRVFAMNAGDRDKTRLASDLGALVVGK
ncbi:hypothetical protein BRADI_2g32990v3 [Brachypodium distachyon]|uniref:Pectinesterase inhibitor domain-containing protein n=1 Tax=Brachypodium distachyon TaxID=15368 RepID=I1HL01_BRADI|nr:hypothetical protein BRADI_2g32990v3 [Brachypodium distachyon]